MIWHEVAPRYTPGTPGEVTHHQAARCAEQELLSYIRAVTWARGYVPGETDKADRLGLAGIVMHVESTSTGYRVCDVLTGWRGTIPARTVGDLAPGLAEQVQQAQGVVTYSRAAPEWEETIQRALHK